MTPAEHYARSIELRKAITRARTKLALLKSLDEKIAQCAKIKACEGRLRQHTLNYFTLVGEDE